MSPITIEDGKATLFYERKNGLPDYSSESASMFRQVDIDPNASDDAVIAAARAGYAVCKAIVMEQLGIEFSVTADGRIVDAEPAAQLPAALADAFPGAAVAPAAPFVPDVTQNVGTPVAVGTNPFAGKKAVYVEGVGNLWDVLASQPDQFFDNRGKKQTGEYKPNAPDFKHKDSSKGLWLDSK